MKKKKKLILQPLISTNSREFLYAPQNQHARCVRYDFLSSTEDKDKRIS